MERKEACSLGDVLRQVIADSNMSGKLDELRAADYWPALVGEHLASLTMRPHVCRGVMTIRVPDAALRHELSMQRSAMARQINRLMEKDVIKEIRFTG